MNPQIQDAGEPPLVTIKRLFPRIGKSIEFMWGNRELDEYLNKLILADREGREGFPAEVLGALLKLHNQHVAQFGFLTAEETWARGPKSTRAENR